MNFLSTIREGLKERKHLSSLNWKRNAFFSAARIIAPTENNEPEGPLKVKILEAQRLLLEIAEEYDGRFHKMELDSL